MQQRYVNGGTVPKSIGKGRVLAHNHVRHTIDMPCGVNGFRAWTWARAQKLRHFVRCGCGWSGLPHYRADMGSKRLNALADRCMTVAQFKRRNPWPY